ncbi:hypothetical protein T484DRAFT_1807355 [Baffinella frigidus]|nr:hypothetical protein T484DRAFT_1807355 [Cryptophyta sp. CCMP2293]
MILKLPSWLVEPDSSYDVLWRLIKAEPNTFPLTMILWFAVTCLCTFLALGLFVAVVTGTFKKSLAWILWFAVTCLCTCLALGLFVAVVTGTFKKPG